MGVENGDLEKPSVICPSHWDKEISSMSGYILYFYVALSGIHKKNQTRLFFDIDFLFFSTLTAEA